jgi:hypothetical protein
MSYGGGGPASRLLAEGLQPTDARMGARGEALPANRVRPQGRPCSNGGRVLGYRPRGRSQRRRSRSLISCEAGTPGSPVPSVVMRSGTGGTSASRSTTSSAATPSTAEPRRSRSRARTAASSGSSRHTCSTIRARQPAGRRREPSDRPGSSSGGRELRPRSDQRRRRRRSRAGATGVLPRLVRGRGAAYLAVFAVAAVGAGLVRTVTTTYLPLLLADIR